MAAITLHIPNELHPGVATLLALDDPAFQQLSHVLAHIPPTSSMHVFVTQVAQQLPDYDPETLGPIIHFLAMLHVVQFDAHASIEEVVAATLTAIDHIPADRITRPYDEGVLAARITTMLHHDTSLGVVAQATYWPDRQEYVFVLAQLYPDVRPLFQHNPMDRPVASLLRHTLQLSYAAHGQLQSLYLSLDSEDVQTLLTLLSQAAETDARIASWLTAMAALALARQEDPHPATRHPWQQTAPVPEAYSQAMALLERTVTDLTNAAVLPELVTAMQQLLDEHHRAGDDAEGR